MRKLQTIPAGHCSLCMSAETYFGTIYIDLLSKGLKEPPLSSFRKIQRDTIFSIGTCSIRGDLSGSTLHIVLGRIPQSLLLVASYVGQCTTPNLKISIEV